MGGKRRRPNPAPEPSSHVAETPGDFVPPKLAGSGFKYHRDEPLLADLGITMRQEELLYWVAEGKRSDEIATILHIRTRTIEKHIENVFEKLKVETRGAAVAIYNRRAAAAEYDRKLTTLQQENDALHKLVAALRLQIRKQ
ncbi:MAG: helix-turn-helix transcriptional regulator [Verrucomicrobiota bacterium]|nr:helix-turn-helix transcriptional regulator [Verrucomicrobiota bacterium]